MFCLIKNVHEFCWLLKNEHTYFLMKLALYAFLRHGGFMCSWCTLGALRHLAETSSSELHATVHLRHANVGGCAKINCPWRLKTDSQCNTVNYISNARVVQKLFATSLVKGRSQLLKRVGCGLLSCCPWCWTVVAMRLLRRQEVGYFTFPCYIQTVVQSSASDAGAGGTSS